jgi:excisionase family DNA binding protein
MAILSDSDICTSKKAAQLLSVTPRTVQLWADAGVLKSWKTPGGHRRYSVSEVMKLAQKIRDGELSGAGLISDRPPLRLLVVEDDDILLALYRATIESWQLPIDLELAADGYSGMLKAGVHKPDLLLLDINLPNIDGYKVVESFLTNGLLTSMKLVIVSGLPAQEIRQNLPEGIDYCVLGKPIPFDYIKQIVQTLLSEQRAS